MAWQFRLRTLLLMTFYVACVVLWAQWTWPTPEPEWRYYARWQSYVPGWWGVVACCVMLSVGVARCCAAPYRTCWNWLLFGALIALANHVDGVFDCFHCHSCCGYAYREILESFQFNRLNTLAVPMIVGAPIAFIVLPKLRSTAGTGDRFVTAALAMGLANILLLNANCMIAYSLVDDWQRATGRTEHLIYLQRAAGETSGDDKCCASSASD